jgi:hypothetical protein
MGQQVEAVGGDLEVGFEFGTAGAKWLDSA